MRHSNGEPMEKNCQQKKKKEGGKEKEEMRTSVGTVNLGKKTCVVQSR